MIIIRRRKAKDRKKSSFDDSWKAVTTMVKESTGRTGASELTNDLVSVLYHALKETETCDRYIKDAEHGGDAELAKFFQDAKEENSRRAGQAKQLLVKRLNCA